MIAFTCAQLLDIVTTAVGLKLGFTEINTLALRHLWLKPAATALALLILVRRPRYASWATLAALGGPAWNAAIILWWFLR